MCARKHCQAYACERLKFTAYDLAREENEVGVNDCTLVEAEMGSSLYLRLTCNALL